MSRAQSVRVIILRKLRRRRIFLRLSGLGVGHWTLLAVHCGKLFLRRERCRGCVVGKVDDTHRSLLAILLAVTKSQSREVMVSIMSPRSIIIIIWWAWWGAVWLVSSVCDYDSTDSALTWKTRRQQTSAFNILSWSSKKVARLVFFPSEMFSYRKDKLQHLRSAQSLR